MSTPKPRDWYIPVSPFSDDDQNVLAEELGRIIYLLTRLGGAQSIVADRQEVEPGVFMTVGFMCRYESYAPAKRYEEPAVEDEAEESVPVEAAA